MKFKFRRIYYIYIYIDMFGVLKLTMHAVFGTCSRELAYQIAEQFRVLGKPLGLRDCIIVGGMGKTQNPP